MSTATKIEWTDVTWNPVRGCALVSKGCTNCYAMRQAHRFSRPAAPFAGLTKMTAHGPTWTGKVSLHPELLDAPLRWRKPRRVFVNSMSDLFHEDVDEGFIADVFSVMTAASRHTFQILTKRPARMRDFVSRWRGGALANVWLGVSVEDQAAADERIPLLLDTPAAVRFLSCEPLLGPLSFVVPFAGAKVDALAGARPGIPGLDWVIAGGESGPDARPCDVDWIRSIVEQCRAADVPVFVKQLGADARGWCKSNAPEIIGEDEHRRMLREDPRCCDNFEASEQQAECNAYGRRCVMMTDAKGGDPAEWPEDLRVREFPA